MAATAVAAPALPRAALVGPAFVVAVGYIDPGNWGTDLAAGSGFGYRLLWVLVVANATAVFLQYLSAKLGIASGKHLAEVMGERLHGAPRALMAGLIGVALVATETAEFLGVVVGLRLLLGLPLAPAVALGAALVLGLFAVGGDRRRRLELAIIGLLVVVGLGYVIEMWLTRPGPSLVEGLVPGAVPAAAVPLVAGLIGATVMPHNLFLHSALVRRGDRTVLRTSTVETAIALNGALLVNGAILVMAAAVLHPTGRVVDSLGAAAATLEPLLGRLAVVVFAVALLASGLAATATGGLAGQYVMEGFTRYRIPLLVRRTVTMVPAVVVLALGVPEVGALVVSQAVLSLALPATVALLVAYTSDRGLMGELANGRAARIVAAVVMVGLVALNVGLLAGLVREA